MTITTSPISDGFYTGLNLTFTGKAEFHRNVDTPLHVSGTWFKMTPFSDLRADPRVRLEEPHLVLNGSRGTMVYESSLTLNGLNAVSGDSGDYTFSLEISSHPHTIGTRSNSTRSITVLRKEKLLILCHMKTMHLLPIAAPPQTVSVSQSPDGVIIAGDQQYSLLCHITRAATLPPSTLLEVMWLDPDNDTIVSGVNNYTIRGVFQTNATSFNSALVFNRITTSQGGMYSCAVNMTVPDVVIDHQVVKTVAVRVTSEC